MAFESLSDKLQNIFKCKEKCLHNALRTCILNLYEETNYGNNNGKF